MWSVLPGGPTCCVPGDQIGGHRLYFWIILDEEQDGSGAYLLPRGFWCMRSLLIPPDNPKHWAAPHPPPQDTCPGGREWAWGRPPLWTCDPPPPPDRQARERPLFLLCPCCGSLSPRWPQCHPGTHILRSLLLCRLFLSQGWPVVSRVLGSDNVWFPMLGSNGCCRVGLILSDGLCRGEDMHGFLGEALRNPVGRPTGQGAEASHQQPILACQAYEWLFEAFRRGRP